MAQKMLDMGCFEISLGDTTGTATPGDIRRLLETLLKEIPAAKLRWTLSRLLRPGDRQCEGSLPNGNKSIR
jgi:hypothetical protein